MSHTHIMSLGFNLIPRVSPQGTGRGETLGMRLIGIQIWDTLIGGKHYHSTSLLYKLP